MDGGIEKKSNVIRFPRAERAPAANDNIDKNVTLLNEHNSEESALEELKKVQREIDRALKANEYHQEMGQRAQVGEPEYRNSLQERARKILSIEYRAGQLVGKLKARDHDALSEYQLLKSDWTALRDTFPKSSGDLKEVLRRRIR